MIDATHQNSAAVAEAVSSEYENPSMEDSSIAQHEIDRMALIRRYENGM